MRKVNTLKSCSLRSKTQMKILNGMDLETTITRINNDTKQIAVRIIIVIDIIVVIIVAIVIDVITVISIVIAITQLHGN